jgi:hypothetical protein
LGHRHVAPIFWRPSERLGRPPLFRLPGADVLVGPPLTGIGGRMYIAGVLTNTPQHMMRWIMDPPAIDSAAAMPNVGVTEKDARDIAACLYAVSANRDP